MTMRPPWGKLARKIRRGSYETDFSVSPVHDVEDDVDEEPPTPPPVAEPLVTGVTAEYPTSEFIYTDEGDIVTAVTE